MDRAEVDRNLLFGLLAMQTGLIDRSALTDALKVWCAEKSRPLAAVLAEQGALPAEPGERLDALVREHLHAHGDDPTRSLAAVEADPSTLASIRALGDPDLEATVEVIGVATTQPVSSTSEPGFGVGTSAVGSGRFRVLRPHKRGGLGAVFVALDAELNREVALKQILDKHADDPGSRSRFLLEAEITGGLEHPGIVPVYALGAFEDGRPYYAMRFIKGDSLKDAIRAFHHRGSGSETTDPSASRASASLSSAAGAVAGGSRELGLRRLLRRFLDVCNAVEYAHQRGVLHRDLKPGNVMVGKYGETLVVDWGLAKAMGRPEPGTPESEPAHAPPHSSGTVETLPGSALGTPAYMSPEQADGDLERLGPRSDVYSLGATLYCVLTGRPPFEGTNAADVIRKVRAGALHPPRSRDATIDPALEAITLRAMALKPEDRYPTPAALAEEVDRWMADEPVAAYPEPRWRKAARWARRNSARVTGAVAFLAASTIALGFVAWLVARQNQRLELARYEADTAGAMAHRAVRTMLSDVAAADLLNVPEGELLRVKLAERALELYRDFEKARPVGPVFDLEHARVEEQVAGLYRMIGQYDQSKVEYLAAIDRFGRLALANPGSTEILNDLAHTEGQLAEMIKLSGGTDTEAEPHYRDAVRLAEYVVVLDPTSPRFLKLVADTSSDLAGMLVNAGRVAEAEPLLARALDAATGFRASLPADPDPANFRLDWVVLPLIQSNRAGALTKLGRGAEGEASAKLAVDGFRMLLQAYPQSNDVRYLLANALMERADARATDPARLGEALGDLDEAVELFEPLKKQYPSVAFYPRFLATLRAARGTIRLAANRLPLAREDLEYAGGVLAERARAEKIPADPLRELGKVKADLARLTDREGNRERARAIADEAVNDQRQAQATEPNRPIDLDLLSKHEALRRSLEGPRP
jgi:serine/threonine-protein kinase